MRVVGFSLLCSRWMEPLACLRPRSLRIAACHFVHCTLFARVTDHREHRPPEKQILRCTREHGQEPCAHLGFGGCWQVWGRCGLGALVGEMCLGTLAVEMAGSIGGGSCVWEGRVGGVALPLLLAAGRTGSGLHRRLM